MASRPSFPSLYSPHIVFNPSSVSPASKYLDNAHDIYVFTLYWTLILYLPLFLLTGSCAALLLAFESVRRERIPFSRHESDRLAKPSATGGTRHRSIAYSIAVLLLYGIAGVLLSVMSSTVVGFLIAGVYAAGKFRVSTWIPFLWALSQSLVTLTSMCTLVIDII